jgi:hypothetical protein
MRYDRTVIAYHGCDEAVARRLLEGEPFKKSRNNYDWLGEGVYFWEHGYDRALQFAKEQQRRGKVKAPAVVGALLQLGRCFDLLDTIYTAKIGNAFELYRSLEGEHRRELPVNAGDTPDKLLRRRDCSVLNFYLGFLDHQGGLYDSVRCAIHELEREVRLFARALVTMTREEFFQLQVKAGIYTEDGKLTPFYREDAEPSPYRPDLDLWDRPLSSTDVVK